jgi:hypothetical protein
VGTAGAQHYRRPPNYTDAKESAEQAYGYLLATVHPDGTIDFNFKEVKQDDIPVGKDYCAPVAEPAGPPKAP